MEENVFQEKILGFGAGASFTVEARVLRKRKITIRGEYAVGGGLVERTKTICHWGRNYVKRREGASVGGKHGAVSTRFSPYMLNETGVAENRPPRSGSKVYFLEGGPLGRSKKGVFNNEFSRYFM